ncbi:hypothetical protein HMPREF9250_00057, partial [Lactobacillus crispatus FB049-03]
DCITIVYVSYESPRVFINIFHYIYSYLYSLGFSLEENYGFEYHR